MTIDEKSRLRSILEKVNLLEQLHKTCQLAELGLQSPILNESRYLSRALIDALTCENDDNRRNDCLSRAELAVASGINDAIDILVLHCKGSCRYIQKHYPSFEIVCSPWADEYIETLDAIDKVEGLIVYSRGNRHDRAATYQRLGTEFAPELNIIANFARKLRPIEEQAKKYEQEKPTAEGVKLLSLMLQSLKGNDENFGFQLYLQGKFALEPSQSLIGAEALLRFRLGDIFIPPSVFIPIAESSGLIASLGQWVLTKVLQLLAKHITLPPISINLTAQELASPNFSSDTLACIKSANVPGDKLEFEITERTAITNLEAIHQLNQLFDAGCKFAIDDFGTGETRFDYLAELPIQVIKIDMSLVEKFKANPDRYGKLLRAIAAVAKSCNLELIAEGIEEKESAEELAKLDIHHFQGFYFEKPMPCDDFIQRHCKTQSP